jgi:proline iminopeptidase
MSGAIDWIMPAPFGAERIAAAIPGSAIVRFDRSGHFPFAEEPEAFADVLHGWLANLR